MNQMTVTQSVSISATDAGFTPVSAPTTQNARSMSPSKTPRNSAPLEELIVMPTMNELVELATAHSADRTALQLAVMAMQEEMEEVKRRYFPALSDLVGACAKSHLPLMAMLSQAERLFVRPKSVVVDQVQIGFETKERKIEVKDEQAIICQIKASVDSDLVPTLVATEESLRLSALKAFDDETLMGLGIAVKPATNRPFVRAINTKVSKLVDAMVTEALGKYGD